MDKRLDDALQHAKFLESLKTQKRLLKEKFLVDSIVYFNGHTFTATPELIAFAKDNLSVYYLVDDNGTPVKIEDKNFFGVLYETHQKAAKEYFENYQKLINSNRTVQDLLDV